MAARMRGKRFYTDTRAILAPQVRKGSKEKRIGVLEHFGRYDVSKITAGMVREYFQKVDEKRDTPLAASTKAKHGMVIRKVLTLAYEDGLIDSLPPMPKNRVKDNPRTSFTEAEYKHLLKVTRECIERGDLVRNTAVPWDMYYLIVMLVHTFMRPTESEIFAIRHCDVTIKDDPKCLHIMANGKTGMREVTTMPDAVDFYETLKELNPEWQATDRLLFPVYGSVVKRFHYMLSNPPYGVDWKKYADAIKDEHEEQGMNGRFGAGLPRISDGQLLFLQHMISKMRQDEQGSRIGIVMNGSPLFTGGAGSGESEIRRWMLENDWVEAIIALPTDLFYNTGIQTYVWLLTNRKQPARRGKVQLIDASGDRFWKSMRKNLGSKRKEIPQSATDEITRLYSDMLNGESDFGEFSKIFATTDFGYREIRVERPLKLAFEVTPERIDALRDTKTFIRLDKDDQDGIVAALLDYLPEAKKWLDRDEFTKALDMRLCRLRSFAGKFCAIQRRSGRCGSGCLDHGRTVP